MADRFELKPDRKGAIWSSLFHGAALFMSAILSLEYYLKDHSSFLFYLFFFSFWLALFSGVTSVFNHCLLLFPKSLKTVRIGDRSVILEYKNGDADEIVKKLQFQGGRTILGVWGETIDKRRVQVTVRRNALSKEEFNEVLKELGRIRDLEKVKA